jgi:hypothetical protein
MSRAFQPWEFVILVVAGWINRHQQAVIEYLMEENRVLKAQLRGKRLRLTNDGGLQSKANSSVGESSLTAGRVFGQDVLRAFVATSIEARLW